MSGACLQLHDNDGESFLAALDAKTGKEIWHGQAHRPRLPARLRLGDAARSGRTTQRTEIVTIGRGFVISYDLDGKELWRCKGFRQSTPSPIVAGGLLYVGSGSQGEANRPLFAVRPGAAGDITLKEGETSNASSSLVVCRASPATRRRRWPTAAGSTR
jgi:outer membrane protein assembly factor BamB